MNKLYTLNSIEDFPITLVFKDKPLKGYIKQTCDIYASGIYHNTVTYKVYNREWALYAGQHCMYKAIDSICKEPALNNKYKFELDRVCI